MERMLFSSLSTFSALTLAPEVFFARKSMKRPHLTLNSASRQTFVSSFCRLANGKQPNPDPLPLRPISARSHNHDSKNRRKKK